MDFIVNAERGKNVWVLECPEVGAVSQTENLSLAAEEMREPIAYLSGLDEQDVNIIVKQQSLQC